jgi:hypothetical protein
VDLYHSPQRRAGENLVGFGHGSGNEMRILNQSCAVVIRGGLGCTQYSSSVTKRISCRARRMNGRFRDDASMKMPI